MDKNVIWAWAIKNSVAMLAWTALAIVFNKWWIALFALLFISGLKTGYKSYRVCDKCGKHSPYADSYNEALRKAIEAGWVHVADGNRDYCPDCVNKISV
jgi:predicted secreted protein